MRWIGEVLRGFMPWNTYKCDDRIFSFSRSNGRLVVTEAILGEVVDTVKVETGAEIGDRGLVCCAIEKSAIVMGVEVTSSREIGCRETKHTYEIFAVLVVVEEGRLSKETVHVSPLTVTGDTEWEGLSSCGPPRICQVSAKRLLLYFGEKIDMWYCDFKAGKLVLTRLPTQMPLEAASRTVPLRISDGRILIAGSTPASRDITMVSCEEDIQFEKVGEIPGLARSDASVILLGERFVVGFGGFAGGWLDDAWIFDTQTHRVSIVWERDEWARVASTPALVLSGSTLYIIGEKLHSITLQALSELIEDDEIRGEFCKVLKLPSASKFVPQPVAPNALSGMTSIGGSLPVTSYNTVQQGERAFHFSLNGSDLLISELMFYEQRAKLLTASAGVTMGGGNLSCCLLGDRILVMSGRSVGLTDTFQMLDDGRYDNSDNSDTSDGGNEGATIYAVLLTVGEGRLSESTVLATSLAVKGDRAWPGRPYLCQASDSRILLYFDCRKSLRYCDITDTTVTLTKLPVSAPTNQGFGTVPIHFSDGKLLVQGGDPAVTDITLISCGEYPRLEKIGDIPGKARSNASSVLVYDRFVIGFGGSGDNHLDDIWIFDRQTYATSQVRKGDWHPADCLVFLMVQKDTLYLVGGSCTTSVNSVSLSALSDLIKDIGLRLAFRSSLTPPSASQSPRSSTDELSRLKLALAQEQFKTDQLSKKLASVKAEADRVPGLRRSLKTAREEICNLEKKVCHLQAELVRVTPPLGTLQLRLPFHDLPAPSFPQKWKINLKRFQAATDKQQLKPSPTSASAREYRRSFASFLEKGFQAKLFSLEASIPVRAARDTLARQVSGSIPAGHLFRPTAELLSLAKLHPLRPMEKLLDSPVPAKVFSIQGPRFDVGDVVSMQVSSTHFFAASLLKRSDSLSRDSAHQSVSHMRRVVSICAKLKTAEQTKNVSKIIQILLQSKKRGDELRDRPVAIPWLNLRERPQAQQVAAAERRKHH